APSLVLPARRPEAALHWPSVSFADGTGGTCVRSVLVGFDERVDVRLVHPGEGVRGQGGEHVRVGPGRRPDHSFPAAGQVRWRTLAALAVRAAGLGVVGRVPAAEPAGFVVGNAEGDGEVAAAAGVDVGHAPVGGPWFV